MDNIIKFFVISIACVLLTACNEPTLNTTNNDTIKESITLMKKQLSDRERNQLDADIHDINRLEVLKLIRAGTPKMVAAMSTSRLTNERINGLTAKEIHEMSIVAVKDGNQIIAELDSRQ
ncbi:DUF6694 family lipoprotein [Pseudomonas sp. A-B-26]|uniref:DUF6694 family lipoprotein n=1 Tax=Pseudomonas sp. A-B-26 TaxID=2832406 RepID=UPI001CBE1179|nr:DUF6694 family lipoprotein [Pseudomonas sp. A-B-26]